MTGKLLFFTALQCKSPLYVRANTCNSETERNIMSQNKSLLCCKVAWCYCRQRCKWWIVAGNHADGNWSLISLQPYQVPCPRYKCHLSPHDLNRKSSKSKLSSCHKHCFGIVQELVSLFWGISFFQIEVSFSLLLPRSFFFLLFLFTHPHMHMGKHKNASIFERPQLSLHYSLK